MKKTLRIVAAILFFGAMGFWLASGANRGWTKTSVPKKTVDDVTGIEGVTYEQEFIPGLDFLGGSVIGAGILAGASFLFRNKKAVNQQPSQI
jgi:hypothetical protein